MDLKKLETFRYVAMHGSLGHAAAHTGLTLPAVSIQIKRLEAELGVHLFDHHPKKLILTEQGQSFLIEVNRVFEALERAKAAASKPTEGYVGSLSISLSTDLARFFAPKIAAFVHQHPNLDVAILARPSRESLAQVVNGEMDMGVGFFRKVPRGITKRQILETDISLVLPDGHPLGRRRRPTLEEIAAYRVVMRRRLSPTRRVIDTAFSDNAIEPPRIVEVGRCQSAMDFVELGLGVGFVHSICASAERHKGLRLLSMSRYFGKMDVSLITRSNAVLGPAHEALIRVFLDGSLASQDALTRKREQVISS